MLNPNAYLKRNALFYLVNNQLLRLFVLSKTNINLTCLTGSLLVKTIDMNEKVFVSIINILLKHMIDRTINWICK